MKDNLVVFVGVPKCEHGISIVHRYPQAFVSIQYLPNVVSKACSSTLEDLSDRVGFMTHNFPIEQPVRGEDVYYFRSILHDGSDAYSLRKLRALIPVLRRRINLMPKDYIVPKPGEILSLQDRHCLSIVSPGDY